ncbi:alpha/beta hydrolase family protein [Actinoallomurus sp. CA-150999]|uniref:alpha/beta hydrolase family protein n=1 Tax=Actinoallomurus sp. CA-150999 TaxID=3239887 RepID=UPI003D8EF12B
MLTFLDDPAALPAFIASARSRAVSAGVDACEYDAVTAPLTTLRDWPTAFRRAGREHLEAGERAENEGRLVSAGEAYRDAALWFHFATTIPHPDRNGHGESADAMRRALTCLDPTWERIDAGDLVGTLRRPAGVPTPPLVVVIPGMDSGKEEFVSIADALLRRGLATLAIDGPGQGELAPRTAPRPDYDKVTSAAIDAIDGRDDLDTGRIGAIALSLGGFYGALSLAAEPRLRSGVLVSGVTRLDWDALPPFVTETLTLRTGSVDAAREFARRVDATGVPERIEQPLLVVDGGRDVIPGATNGADLARHAPRGEYLLIPEGDHLVANARWTWLPHAADRLARHLTGSDR